MVLHPCDDGLTKECFKAYPQWARQALAYKLLHLLVPKQLTRLLPRGLNLPLIGPGAVLPPGLELPPGTAVPPDYTFPPDWKPADPLPPGVIIPPGTVFPPGWKPGDPLPPGVIIEPGTVFPPDWKPGDPLPPAVTPPPSDMLPPLPGGPLPPLYVEPFEPGPVHGPSPSAAPAFDIGSLIVEQGITQTFSKFGDTLIWADLAMPIKAWRYAEITAVDIKIGKYNNPTDNVHLEIWKAVTNYYPSYALAGGTSTAKAAASLPAFALDQDYVRFLFPQKPIVLVNWPVDIVVARSGPADPINYFKVGQNIYPEQTFYYKLPDNTWYSRSGGIFNFNVWGFNL